jgi:hypothetical protein
MFSRLFLPRRLKLGCVRTTTSSSTPTVTLTKLPTEVFLEVLKGVDLAEIRELRLVCQNICSKCDPVFRQYISTVQAIEMTPRSIQSLHALSRSPYQSRILEIQIIIPHISRTDEVGYLREDGKSKGAQHNNMMQEWERLMQHLSVQSDYVDSQEFIEPLKSAFEGLCSCRVIRVHHNRSVIPGANLRPLKGGPQTTYTNIFKICPNENRILDSLFIPLFTTLNPGLKTVDMGDLTYTCGRTRGVDLFNYTLSSTKTQNYAFQQLTSLRLRLYTTKIVESRNDNLAFFLRQTSQLKTLHLHFDNENASLLFFQVRLPVNLSELLLSGLDASCAGNALHDIVRTANNLERLSLLHCYLHDSWRDFLSFCLSKLTSLRLHCLLEPGGKIEWPDSSDDSKGGALTIVIGQFDKFQIQISEAYIDDKFWDFVRTWWPHDRDAWRLFVENGCGLCSHWFQPFY